jgi:CheY-like chemotaxis protein
MTNARILIVEDEAITVSALKRELASLGYQVAATASTADEALNAVELHKPDLVLMDITLAGTVNGIVAAVAIRGNFHLPVVFLTAHADDGTMERAVAAGAFGYVLKPFSGPGLKAAIETALHKYQTEIESRRALIGPLEDREPHYQEGHKIAHTGLQTIAQPDEFQSLETNETNREKRRYEFAIGWKENVGHRIDRRNRLRDCPYVGAGRIICRYHWPHSAAS